MSKSNNLKNKLSYIDRDTFTDCYLKIDFLLQKGFACDINEAKRLVNNIIFHRKATDLYMAHHCLELCKKNNDYILISDYVDHEAALERLSEYGNANIDDFVDCKSLGKDMFEKDFLIDAYYRWDKYVFEILEGKGWHRGLEPVEPKVAKYCYKAVKKQVKEGWSIDIAVNRAYKEILDAVAA